ncbi:hypothetical protein CFC21_006330 [Triticum aestivum]|uniref:Uncharacterized protein n=3 Tax=Triticum TaxID=4564 RepID=A0A9R0QVT9_TRITD|nr:hypothetical protein CFC21_006330 [Triticum aestivum]VAH16092.1 unnamed protein product [Triticum turgidum subsp. durum]
MSCRNQAATVEDEDDLPSFLAQGRHDAMEEIRQHPHNQGGSKLAAGDKIHTNIACTDGDGTGTMEIDELASSPEQLLLGPCYPSVAVDRFERSTRRIGAKPGAVDG